MEPVADPQPGLSSEQRQRYLDAIDAATELALRRCQRVSGGLRSYTALMWPVLEPAQPFIDNWHIGIMCEVLEAVSNGDVRDVIITVPPRHSKSLTVAVMWPTWEWGPRNLPHTRWIFSSYAQSLSVRDSQKRRRLMATDLYMGQWGDRFVIGGNRYTSDGAVKYENDHTGYHLATSVQGSNTGEGGDRIVVDDPLNVKFAHSDVIRESTNSWWDAVMSTRRNNPQKSARVIIMQRTHERDIPGHIGAKEDHGFLWLNLPTEYEPPGCTIQLPGRTGYWQDPRTTPGELLNPHRFGPKEVREAKRDLGTYAYSAQHQQRPTPAEGGILKKVFWRWYAPKGHWMVGREFQLEPGYPVRKVVELPDGLDVMTSWDMSFKEEGAGNTDYVAAGAWGYDPGWTAGGYGGSSAWLLDEVHDRLGFAATATVVVDFRNRYPGMVLVEDKANGPAIIDHLRNRVPGLVANDPGSRSKIERAHAVQPYCEAGNVFLPVPQYAPWIKEYIHELAVFPNGAYDDRVDQTTQALERIFGGVVIRTGEMTSDIDI